MLSIGQKRSRENAALTAEPCCTSDFSWLHTPSGELSEGVSGSHNHRKAVASALQKLFLYQDLAGVFHESEENFKAFGSER